MKRSTRRGPSAQHLANLTACIVEAGIWIVIVVGHDNNVSDVPEYCCPLQLELTDRVRELRVSARGLNMKSRQIAGFYEPLEEEVIFMSHMRRRGNILVGPRFAPHLGPVLNPGLEGAAPKKRHCWTFTRSLDPPQCHVRDIVPCRFRERP